MIQKISIKDARKIALHSQRLFAQKSFGKGVSAVLKTIQHLGYIQIDTISVIERAHHHTFWNRVDNYQTHYLEQLQREGEIFEYWAHALAYLPIEDYRFSLPQMRRFAEGKKHWYPKDHKETEKVLERIKNEGPLRTDDFEGKRQNVGGWGGRKPSKIALEQLFIEGKLMIPYREKFQKVYDLTERVLPSHVNTQEPSSEELVHFLITQFLKAHGLGKAEEIRYLRKGVSPMIRQVLNQMVEAEEIIHLDVNGETYYSIQQSLNLLDKPIPRKKLKILSPFDNLVIQRKRLKDLFNFDYLIECYVPKDKRKFGYFSLPLLWNGQLVARMDAKASRTNGTLIIQNLVLENSLKKVDEFVHSLILELKRFAHFNQCDELLIHQVSKPKLDQHIMKAWNASL